MLTLAFVAAAFVAGAVYGPKVKAWVSALLAKVKLPF